MLIFRNTYSSSATRSKDDRKNTIKALILKFKCRDYSNERCSQCLQLLYGHAEYIKSPEAVSAALRGLRNDPLLREYYCNDKWIEEGVNQWIQSKNVDQYVHEDLQRLRTLQQAHRGATSSGSHQDRT